MEMLLRDRDASGISTRSRCALLVPILLTWLPCLLDAPMGAAYGYNTGDHWMAEEVHQWITEKAVELLLRKPDGVARLYPLPEYLDDLEFGVWVADHSGIQCVWSILWGSFQWAKDCDSVHHYGEGRQNTISTWGGNVVARMGELPAEVYAQGLYELAVTFWPGAEGPRLDRLRYVDAGEIDVLHDRTSLMKTYVGGWPLCELYHYNIYGDEARARAECPKWPWWTSGAESVGSAMRYLGWALHMIQDLTVYYHVVGQATSAHESWENDVSTLVKAGVFDHLPGGYVFCSDARKCGLRMYCRDPQADPRNCELWDILAEMDVLAQLLSFDQFLDYIVSTGSLAIADKYPEDAMETKELRLDFAIRASAAAIERFFAEIAPPREDSLEENDSEAGARTLAPGTYPARYTGLTVFPDDGDWYRFDVPSDSSDIAIDVLWESPGRSPMPWLNALLSVPGPSGGFNVLGDRTSDGTRVSLRGGGRGYYLLHIWSLLPLRYELVISVAQGRLPADAYDRVSRNDTPETASRISALSTSPQACYERLNIDSVADEDYYSFSLPGGTWRVEASIVYAPSGGRVGLYLNGEEARLAIIRGDGSVLRKISTCTSGAPALVRVTGARNEYDLCVTRSADAGCLGVPRIRVSPESCLFGGYAVGDVSPDQTVTISNDGTADLRVSGFVLSDEANFRLNPDRGSCGRVPLSLAPGRSCTIALQFAPRTAQAKIRESLTILSDDPASPSVRVGLYGSSVLLSLSGSSMPACDAQQRFVVSGGTRPYTFEFLVCTRMTTPWGAPGHEICSWSFPLPSNMSVEYGEDSFTLGIAGCVPEWLTHLFVQVTDARGISTVREIIFLSAGNRPFRRADANQDGRFDLADSILILMYLFANGTEPPCLDAADANDTGAVDLADAIYLLNWLFAGGPRPAAPHPGCGADPTADDLGCMQTACP